MYDILASGKRKFEPDSSHLPAKWNFANLLLSLSVAVDV